MKRLAALVVLLILLSLSEGYEILVNQAYTVPAGKYVTVDLGVNKRDKILGSIFCYYGGSCDVDFRLFSSPNFEKYTNGEQSYYALAENRTSLYTIDYTIPSDAPSISAEDKYAGGIHNVDAFYYVVLSNQFSVATDKLVYIFIIRTKDTKKEEPEYIPPAKGGYDE